MFIDIVYMFNAKIFVFFKGWYEKEVKRGNVQGVITIIIKDFYLPEYCSSDNNTNQ